MVQVFIAEDSPVLRRELCLATPWADLGCVLVGDTQNGREAEVLINKLRPQLVIMDIRMPIQDGLETIENLSHLDDILYIIISAYGDFEYARKAIKLHVYDFILKPIEDAQFYEAIRSAVRSIEEAPGKRPEALTNASLNIHLQNILDYIEGHYAEDITLGEISRRLYISESYISKLFRWELDTSFVDYLAQCRIGKARELIAAQKYRLADISSLVGYGDYKYFCKVFKKITGKAPNAYKKEILSPTEKTE